MHHIISDGWSMGVFMREVSVLYQCFSQKKPSPLADLPIQYADFSSWQRDWLQGEVLDKQLKYWQNKLGHNPPVLELPTDKPGPAVQSSKGSSYDLIIPAKINQAMKRLSRQEGITPFMAYLAVFYVLL